MVLVSHVQEVLVALQILLLDDNFAFCQLLFRYFYLNLLFNHLLLDHDLIVFYRLLARLVDLDGFFNEDAVLELDNILNVLVLTNSIHDAIVVLHLLQLFLVPLSDYLVFLLADSDLVDELGVPLRDLDLILESLFFVLNSAQVVLNELRLDLLLLHDKALLELARASQPRRFVHCALRTAIQIFWRDVAEAIHVADELLGRNLALANDSRLRVEEPVLKAADLSSATYVLRRLPLRHLDVGQATRCQI